MKRLLTGLMAAASCLSPLVVLSDDALAQPRQGWVATTLEEGVANLRSRPSTAAETQATIRNGQSFSILDTQTDDIGYEWHQIRPSGVTPTSPVWIRSDLVSFAPPLAAEPTISCDSAIAQVEDELRSLPNVQIAERRQNRHFYTVNVPQDRTGMSSFSLAGTGAASVMASTVLMNQMAAQIVENCPTTGLVTFFREGDPDGYIHFGYMPENMVRPFQCRKGSDRNDGPPDWGARNCL
ncbi:MAG: SH3 domain-containing protein [Cyanobacteria bacterium J06614_10]